MGNPGKSQCKTQAEEMIWRERTCRHRKGKVSISYGNDEISHLVCEIHRALACKHLTDAAHANHFQPHWRPTSLVYTLYTVITSSSSVEHCHNPETQFSTVSEELPSSCSSDVWVHLCRKTPVMGRMFVTSALVPRLNGWLLVWPCVKVWPLWSHWL